MKEPPAQPRDPSLVCSEEISTPRRHDDQGCDSQFGQFGIVAKQGSRPGAEASERQCHRAHELDRSIDDAPKECIGTPMRFQSQEKTPLPSPDKSHRQGYHTRSLQIPRRCPLAALRKTSAPSMARTVA